MATLRSVKTNFSNEELLNGLKERDRKVLSFFYNEYFGMTLDLVLKNSGNREQARDLFQETMAVLFEKVQDEDFHLSSSVKTYLYAVARNKWLMVLRSKRTQKTDLSDTESLDFRAEESVESDILQNEKYELMRNHLKQLGQDCQKVLEDFFRGCSLREIANKMGFTEGYAKKRKFTCQKKLIGLISADPRYLELIER